MSDVNESATDLDREWGPIKAEYDSALEALQALRDEGETREHVATAAHAAAKRRFERASRAVDEARRYWREVGVMTPDDQPGSRASHGGFGVAVDGILQQPNQGG